MSQVTTTKDGVKATIEVPVFITLEVKDPQGKVLKTIVATLRDFSTGSKGYGASEKVDVGNGARIQASLNLVLIGSKPQA